MWSVNGLKNSLINWLMKEPSHRVGYQLCDFERIKYELRPCDVILVEGMSRVSETIKSITQSTWSHAALYIGRAYDIENPISRERVLQYYDGPLNNQLLIESVLGSGTIISPLDNYKNSHIRICRPTGISMRDAQSVIKFAIGRLGTEYGIRQNFELARLLLPWRFLPRGLRSSFFSNDVSTPVREICSSMIADAFSTVHFPILPIMKMEGDTRVKLYKRNPRLFTPRDFDYSPYFEIIKYPFIAINSGSYKDLPWQEGMASEHDLEIEELEPSPYVSNGSTEKRDN
jgi:hypothetical protein